jgi:exopolysaccharide production protein ExoQ
MPPIVASFLTLLFIVFLFRQDIRQRPNVTGGLWIPVLWMLIICTRQVSEWLNLFGLHVGAITLEEGSPLDAGVYFALIAAGLYVLHQRQTSLLEIVRNNQWLTIFFVYCFISIFWSDFPFVSFKRFIKAIGHPVMALIVLTEPDPREALARLMKRCAYIIVPVSILFIKYYPELGRGFDQWSGAAMNTGITTNKNALGCDCLILGFFFFWHLLQIRRTERSTARRKELLLTAGFLIAISWLFSMAQSSTSLVSLMIGTGLMMFVGLRFVNKRLLGAYVVAGIVVYVLAEATFGISSRVIEFLGKNPTLTDRTALWGELLKFNINPILGTGFESFWLGGRRQMLWQEHWWQPNEAHNGYLETYLNLGLIGLFLLIALIVATFRKARLEVFRNFQFGRFRLGFLAAVVVYNWTEATFKNISPLWFIFYIIALDYRRPEFDSFQQAETIRPEEHETLVYTDGEIEGSRFDF